MDRAAESGLEVESPTNPEVGGPYDKDKYYSEIGSSNNPLIAPPNQSNQFENYYMENRASNYPLVAETDKAKSKAIWVLAIIAVIVLAVALGAGLGAGLAAQHKSNSPA